jgi:hypothetical protein
VWRRLEPAERLTVAVARSASIADVVSGGADQHRVARPNVHIHIDIDVDVDCHEADDLNDDRHEDIHVDIVVGPGFRRECEQLRGGQLEG